MLQFGPSFEGNWETITDFPKYAICDDSRIVSKTTGELRATSFNQGGIRTITLMRDGARITKSVALLVATQFLPRVNFPEFFDTPIHLNGEKGDCTIQNLAWRPRWFAVAYHKQFAPNHPQGRGSLIPGIFIDQTEEIFDDSFDAAIKYGMLNEHIIMALQNEERSSFPFNFTFKYVWGDERDTFLN